MRIAERLEDRRLSRVLSHVTYALWYRDQKKKPSMKKYLRQLGLDNEPEDLFMGPLEEDVREREAEDRAERARMRRAAESAGRDPKGRHLRAVPDLGQPEGQPNEASNDWGDWTLADMQAAKARMAKEERRGSDGDPER